MARQTCQTQTKPPGKVFKKPTPAKTKSSQQNLQYRLPKNGVWKTTFMIRGPFCCLKSHVFLLVKCDPLQGSLQRQLKMHQDPIQKWGCFFLRLALWVRGASKWVHCTLSSFIIIIIIIIIIKISESFICYIDQLLPLKALTFTPPHPSANCSPAPGRHLAAHRGDLAERLLRTHPAMSLVGFPNKPMGFSY